jgi:hypothetical protein
MSAMILWPSLPQAHAWGWGNISKKAAITANHDRKRMVSMIACGCGFIRFLFAYTGSMPALPSPKTSVVRCKGCSRNIPSGTHGVPAQPVAVLCPLCGQRRMYLPVEVNLDRLHASLALRAER